MRNFPAKVAALLLLAAFFVAVLWSNDIDPTAGLARFDGLPGVGVP